MKPSLLFLPLIALLFVACSAPQAEAPRPAPRPVAQTPVMTPQERTEQILEQLKKIPVSEYEQNYTLYKELVELNPGQVYYLKKMKFYKEQMTRVQDIQEALRTIPVQEYQKNYDLYQQLVELKPGNRFFEQKLAFYKERLDKPTPDDEGAVAPADEIMIDIHDEMPQTTADSEAELDAMSEATEEEEAMQVLAESNATVQPETALPADPVCEHKGDVQAGQTTLRVLECPDGGRFETADGARSRTFLPREIREIRQAFIDAAQHSAGDYSDRHKLYRAQGIVIYVKRPIEGQWYILFAFSDMMHVPANVRLSILPDQFETLSAALLP